MRHCLQVVSLREDGMSETGIEFAFGIFGHLEDDLGWFRPVPLPRTRETLRLPLSGFAGHVPNCRGG